MRRARWAIVILWACFILYMSSFASPPGDLIRRTTDILKSADITLPIVPGRTLAFTIGKIGHILEYSLLGLLIFAATRGPSRRRIGATICLGLIVAIADETRQYFVPGREGCVRDVFIDLGGLALGITIALGLRRLYLNYRLSTMTRKGLKLRFERKGRYFRKGLKED